MFQMNQMMKQVKQMQQRMVDEQERAASMEFEGSAGGGMVKLTLTGKHLLKSIQIDPSIVNPEEIAILEDLIIAAHQDAQKKVDAHNEDMMSGMMGGLKLPAGMKLPF